MSGVPTESVPRRVFDEHGRLIPMTEEEVRARAGAIARGLEALDEMGDEAEQRETFARLREAIDADRLSDRRRFR
jgi:hypothetical protein